MLASVRGRAHEIPPLTSVVPASIARSWWKNSLVSFLQIFSTTVFVIVAMSKPILEKNNNQGLYTKRRRYL